MAPAAITKGLSSYDAPHCSKDRCRDREVRPAKWVTLGRRRLTRRSTVCRGRKLWKRAQEIRKWMQRAALAVLCRGRGRMCSLQADVRVYMRACVRVYACARERARVRACACAPAASKSPSETRCSTRLLTGSPSGLKNLHRLNVGRACAAPRRMG
eukprot:5032151-Pleurochrysis_carterae.AAC.1